SFTRPDLAHVARPDPRLAPCTRVERTDRIDQQPDQAHQAHRVRVPQVRPLPHPRPALRRQTELGPTRHHHTPVKSEEADWRSSVLTRAYNAARNVIGPLTLASAPRHLGASAREGAGSPPRGRPRPPGRVMARRRAAPPAVRVYRGCRGQNAS